LIASIEAARWTIDAGRRAIAISGTAAAGHEPCRRSGAAAGAI
jgi:hypothetical protein